MKISLSTSLFSIEQKVEYFNLNYQSLSDFSVVAKLNYTFTWYGNDFSIGFAPKKGEKLYFDLFFTFKASPNHPFAAENFKPDSEAIDFYVSFSWRLEGKDEVSKKLFELSVFGRARAFQIDDYKINLFSYLVYVIR
ncbi:lipoprotein [Mycoplasmoides pneumoniae]|uniref:Uncharacterized protein MPN_649 n=2 Tax=Mycoplasmoides pneumoniae TaxID=2104 RepID=Y649_MYCPN|nr:hypothetical protein [Mycoplasmoides pneumoniae]P75148.1 RecName: Full=Uncharacterized protein MPN_649 [Mycoplasmoides pneumoniae M129]AAB95841.1 hypothetical protein MPN_649 [Mycoplasmoides pneumoniae M129]AJR19089.1 hypothetical protein C985_01390 [Mycoplasmoides pneumoniae M129-B7]ALA30809.1 hypothetical protein B434_01310 [Mycoplasmoides pneumoniae 19294]ALA31909.1 hypothetical protein F536_03635 [Mycoplasmoides pneumoniae 39443]ALA36853.1 hypothetical protein F538_03655 [Mycoplasmoide